MPLGEFERDVLRLIARNRNPDSFVAGATVLHQSPGALNGIAEGRGHRDNSFTVAYLKRAHDHLHKSQAGLEAAAPKKLLPETMIVEARKELFEIREGILKLMDGFRGRT